MKRSSLRSAATAAALALLTCGSASATVSLVFSNGSTGALTNLADLAGNTADGLLWGVIVDAAGDGFDLGTYFSSGLALNTTLSGVVVPGSNDDVFFMDTTVLTSTVAGVEGGSGAATSLSFLQLNSALGVNQGDAFAIVWFNRGFTAGENFHALNGDRYGFYTIAGLTLPADGANQLYTSLFAGPDPVRHANIGVPEPSSLIFSLLGVLPLLRRRR